MTSASRKKLIKFIQEWKESDTAKKYYRPDLVTVDEDSENAPWVQESYVDVAIPSKWIEEGKDELSGSFEGIAEALEEGQVGEVLETFGIASDLVEDVIEVLKESEGHILVIAEEDSVEGFALQYRMESFYGVGVEMDEALNETAISQQLIQWSVPDPNAPAYPGFPPIELQNRLYESLNSSIVLAMKIDEDNVIAEDLNKFIDDLSVVIAESIIDEGTLEEEQSSLLFEVASGVFAGFSRVVAEQFAQKG